MTTIVPEMSSGVTPMRRANEPTEELATATPLPPLPLTGDLVDDARWDAASKRTALVILLVVAGIALWISRPIVPLLLLAGIIAYLLNPIVDLCERLRIPRNVSTIVLYVFLLIGLILLPVFLLPVLIDQLTQLGQFNQSVTAASFINWLGARLNSLPDTIQILGNEIAIGNSLQELQVNFQQMIVVPTLAQILEYIQQLIGTATSLVSSTAVIGISVVGGIVQVFLTLLVTFFLSLYLTKDAPVIRAYVEGLFPPAYQSELTDLLRRIGHIWQSFFRGQLILCFTIGAVTWVALQVAGMPGALIFAIIAGMLEIVPNLGPTLAMIPAVIVALIQGSDVLGVYGINNVSFALITVAIYFIIQQMENNILVPRIIGDSVNLHPIVIICGAVVGFNVAGLLGAFLAAPTVASLRVVGGYVHAKLLDYPPFEQHPLPPLRSRRPFIYRRTIKAN
ncbi:MAG: AI-2E family transporter [Chloroflexota bacterium]|nr:AI-2E family transporter [Chloroflexota bacterium]